MNKLDVLSGLAFSMILGSSVLISPTAKAQSESCDWFTGIYRDQGRGVIVHIGGGQLVVYNGNPNPLRGRCIANDRVEVSFRSNLTLMGRRSANDVAWSNGTVWRRESNTVSYPLSGF